MVAAVWLATALSTARGPANLGPGTGAPDLGSGPEKNWTRTWEDNVSHFKFCIFFNDSEFDFNMKTSLTLSYIILDFLYF